MKLASQAVHGTPMWDQFYKSDEDEAWAEKKMDQFMLNYARGVVAEMGVMRAKEFLDLSDWLAAQKDLNAAIR